MGTFQWRESVSNLTNESEPWEGGGGGVRILTLLFCGLPSFIGVGWPPWIDLPVCKAIIFWCCCSVKAVKAFKCFKVNSRTTAFSRCPRVCNDAKKKGALGYLKTYIWLDWLSIWHSNLSKYLKEVLFLYFSEFSTIQVINDFLSSVVNTYSWVCRKLYTIAQVVRHVIFTFILISLGSGTRLLTQPRRTAKNKNVHLTVNFRCSGSKSFSWAMHSLIRSLLFFSINLCGNL